MKHDSLCGPPTDIFEDKYKEPKYKPKKKAKEESDSSSDEIDVGGEEEDPNAYNQS
jgi:hypothetical protein